MRRHALTYAVSAIICLALALPVAAEPSQYSGLVTAVADGDTITVLNQAKQQVKIRLYGIDSPESGQAFGARAKQATADAVFGKHVAVQPIDVDRYGRTVAVVLMPGGRSLSEHLVREGMAWVYSRYCKEENICGPLRRLEKTAREEQRGLWADKEPVAPWEWRKR